MVFTPMKMYNFRKRRKDKQNTDDNNDDNDDIQEEWIGLMGIWLISTGKPPHSY